VEILLIIWWRYCDWRKTFTLLSSLFSLLQSPHEEREVTGGDTTENLVEILLRIFNFFLF